MSTMTRRLGVLTTSAALALTTVSAAAPTFAGSEAIPSQSTAQRYRYFADGNTTDPQAAELMRRLSSRLPADWKANRDRFIAKTGVEPGPVTRAVLAHLTDAPCQPTEFNAYIERIIRGIPDRRLFILAMLGAFDYATYDALIFGTKADPDYALTPGTAGKVRGAMAAARGLWDIKSGDIDVLAMNSEMVVDRPRVIRLIRFIFGASHQEAAEVADEVIPLILDTAQLRGGDNPIFTLNAFAFTGEGNPDLEDISDRIVMGEGIIKALRDTGNIAVGPQMVLAHEFGHHIQFENDLYTQEPSPAFTRRMELMADAYSTYTDAHNKGLNFSEAAIDGAVEVAHLIGDCLVDNPGHHGTPAQRARAAAWGAALAQRHGNRVISSREFHITFDRALPGILTG